MANLQPQVRPAVGVAHSLLQVVGGQAVLAHQFVDFIDGRLSLVFSRDNSQSEKRAGVLEQVLVALL